MWRTLLLICTLLPLGFVVSAQDKQPAKSSSSTPIYTIPVDVAKRENPVKPTEESLARGKKQYGYDCAMCHGKNGDGPVNYVDGANIGGFMKVADAMLDQGVV